MTERMTTAELHALQGHRPAPHDQLVGAIQSFSLPWPDKALSPNSRLHWSKISSVKKAYKAACRAALVDQKVRPMGDNLIQFEMTFYPPGNYRYDRDNLTARMKSGIDAVSKYIGVDDVNFRFSEVTIGGVFHGGRVQVILRPGVVNVPIVGSIS